MKCVSEKDITCIKSKVSKLDAKYLDTKISGCIYKMSDRKSKKSIIFRQFIEYGHDFAKIASKKDFRELYVQLDILATRGILIPNLGTPTAIVDKYGKFLSKEANGYFQERIKQAKGETSPSDIELVWFNKFYDNKSFCIAQYIENLNYEKLNIVEIKDISSDAYNVRYEIVKKDDSSKKYTLKVEEIDRKWNIVDRPYFKTGVL